MKTFRGPPSLNIWVGSDKTGEILEVQFFGSKFLISHILRCMGKALEAFKNGLSKSSKPNQWDTKPLITFEPLGIERAYFGRR